jgi:hypothetical protein
VKGFCLTDLAGEQRYFLAVADISGRLYVYDIGDLLYNPTYTTFFGSTVPGYLHFGAVLQTGGVSPAVDVSPIDSIELVASVSDDERNYLGGFEVDVRQWQAQPWAASKSHAFLYAGLSRVGIQVCSFDPDAGTLAPVGVVQTPGDATGLYITDETGQAAPNERLMFVGDYDGGIRIYRD